MGPDEYVIYYGLGEKRKLNIRAKDWAIIILSVLILVGWICIGFAIPKYSGQQCECSHTTPSVIDKGDSYSVEYYIFCPLYNGYVSEVELNGFSSYNSAQFMADEIPLSTSTCCVKEGTLYNSPCKRTTLNLVWSIIIPIVIFSLLFVCLMVYSIIRLIPKQIIS